MKPAIWQIFLASVWLLLFSCMPLGAAVDQVYSVKKGDTVHTIAKRFGVSPKSIIDQNGLSDSQHIYPGQRLKIPNRKTKPKGGTKTPTTTPADKAAGLPPEVQRSITQAKVTSGKWKYIVIHHSAFDRGTVKGMDRYHREVRHMENGLAYHFVIGNGSGMGNGEIAVGHRWRAQLDGGHVATEALNQVSLGICLVGNFDKQAPTKRQMASLRALIQALRVRCNIPAANVKTHQQINPVFTRCPGAKFPTKALMSSPTL